jgi:hypothetical protein
MLVSRDGAYRPLHREGGARERVRDAVRLLDAFIDWVDDGGFGRFVYKTLAYLAAIAIVAEVATNGLTDTACIYGAVLAGVLVCLYSGD